MTIQNPILFQRSYQILFHFPDLQYQISHWRCRSRIHFQTFRFRCQNQIHFRSHFRCQSQSHFHCQSRIHSQFHCRQTSRCQSQIHLIYCLPLPRRPTLHLMDFGRGNSVQSGLGDRPWLVQADRSALRRRTAWAPLVECCIRQQQSARRENRQQESNVCFGDS